MNLTKKTINYWNNFYSKKKAINKPTNFAFFCLNYLNSYSGILYDAGCGNGRDTVFFNRKNINTIGLDISGSAIKINKKKNKQLQKKFFKKNFCNYFKKKIKKNFSVYLRFTIHTINYKNEKIFLNSLFKQKNLDYLFIETRTTQDEFYKVGKKVGRNQYISDHFRRFIVPKELKKTLSKKFHIIYLKQSIQFAKYKNFKPNVLRIIAKKKF
tara:strand:+ start:318 stop:953 length:636 start_codon:yes stop_codon:yes gene_type:complete